MYDDRSNTDVSIWVEGIYRAVHIEPGEAVAVHAADRGEIAAYKDLSVKPAPPEKVSSNFRMQRLNDMYYAWSSAVADLGWVWFNGYLAWLTWLFVHILYLIGFENRFQVLFQWAWNYFTRNRSARLITGQDPMDKEVA